MNFFFLYLIISIDNNLGGSGKNIKKIRKKPLSAILRIIKFDNMINKPLKEGKKNGFNR